MVVFFSIGIAQAMFSILLIGKKRELIFADKILMALLLTVGAEFLYSLLNFVYIPELPDFIIFSFLVGPLLYLYTFLLCSEKRELPPKLFYHFLPFLVFLVMSVFYSKYQIRGNSLNSEEYNPGAILIINFMAFAAQSIFYWWAIRSLVIKHKKNLLHKVSIDSDDISLKWIRLLSLFVFWGFVLFFLIDASFFFRGSAPFEPSILLHVGMLIAIYSISFFGFRQEAIFESQQFERYENYNSNNKRESKDEDEELTRLVKFLREEKPYLIRNLTLQDLANNVKIPTYRLSELINKKLNKTFYALINELRVEEAKKRILLPEYNNLTLTAIGFDSGFNSKSSFHDLFKKYTDFTPAQFRKQNS